MNWLAHVVLAGDHPVRQLGALLADALPRDVSRFPEEFQRGVACHRTVDAWVDRHPAVLESRRRVLSLRRRYSGIAVDILYDHLLAWSWSTWMGEDLASWERRFQRETSGWVDILDLPKAATDLWNWATETRILARYHDLDVLEDALRRFSIRMEARLGVEVDLTTVLVDLAKHREGFQADFVALWTEIQPKVAKEFWVPFP